MKWKKEIPSITNLATTTTFNAKINEVKGKVPSITNLANNTALMIMIYDHDHENYTTTQEFNKLTSDNFTARLKQANLATKKILLVWRKK